MPTNLMSFRRILKVGTFNNGINRTSLLAESTVDALGHVNIIPGKDTNMWGAIQLWQREKVEMKRIVTWSSYGFHLLFPLLLLWLLVRGIPEKIDHSHLRYKWQTDGDPINIYKWSNPKDLQIALSRIE